MTFRRWCSILFLCLLFFLFTSGVFRRESGPEDQSRKPGFAAGPTLIFHNANIITMDESLPTAQAVCIEGNRITAVGQDADILSMAGPVTQVIDLEGRTIVPGLIEGHSHIFNHGFQNEGIDGLKRVAEEMAANGFTTVHDMNLHNAGLLDAAIELASRGELAVRINFYPNYGNPDGSLRNDGWWHLHPYTTQVDTLIRIVGVKIYADGGVAGVPAVSVPYRGGSNAGSYGDCWYSQSECDSIVQEIHETGYPIAVHCLGDSGVGVFVNAFDKVFAGGGNTLRHRLEHCRVMREDLTNRMADLGLVASIQYCWAEQSIAERYEEIFYPEVLEWVYPWQRMLDRGVRLVGGNDWPYTSHQQAMQVISSVASRKNEKNQPLSSWLDGDELTIEQAISSMTMDAAWVCFEEDEKGSVTVGKLADLTVLSDDPLRMDPFDVRYITTEMTVMDGIIRYNQLGSVHAAVHDAGTFRLGIDDRGFWGEYRALVGLEVEGEGHLSAGSLLISYEDGITATALFPQFDYSLSDGGSVDFQEPGPDATEEIQVIFEDVREHPPAHVRVTQKSMMWEGDSCALVRYTFTNIGASDLADLYVGQFMDFDIMGWRNLGVWEENGGLGFACMNNPDYADGPVIGMAMFDTTGSHVNTGTSFPIPSRFFTWSEENMIGDLMRSGGIEYSSGDPYDYSMLLSYGPMSLAVNESKSPFTLVLAVSKSVEGLRRAIQDAHDRLLSLYGMASDVGEDRPDLVRVEPFCRSYPNPFNASTTIRFNLEQPGYVRLEIIDLMGRRIETLIDGRRASGEHSVQWNAEGIPAGLYITRLQSSGLVLKGKLILQK